jgi:hypothetical protein
MRQDRGMTDASPPQRRRRRRRSSPADRTPRSHVAAEPQPARDTEPAPEVQPASDTPSPPDTRPAANPQAPTASDHDTTTERPASPKRRRSPREGGGDRGLRDIVGAGRSQLGVSGALRARDVNRPTADELAAAERDVVIVRRNWRPDPPS